MWKLLLLVAISFATLLSHSESATSKKQVKFPPEIIAALIPAAQKCMTQTGVDPEVLLIIYQGKYKNDQKFKDFLYCSYKTMGFLDENNHINVNKSVALFSNEPLVVEGVKRCAQETGINEKDKLLNYYKCFQDTVPVQFTI